MQGILSLSIYLLIITLSQSLSFSHETGNNMGLESLLLGTYLSPVNTLVSGLNSLYSAAAAKSLQSCLTLCDPIDRSPPGSPSLDSPGKNTGVGCHFLLQCMEVKSGSEVARSCPTPSDPMDCSPPGPSVHGIFQARVLEWGAIAFCVFIWAFSFFLMFLAKGLSI